MVYKIVGKDGQVVQALTAGFIAHVLSNALGVALDVSEAAEAPSAKINKAKKASE